LRKASHYCIYFTGRNAVPVADIVYENVGKRDIKPAFRRVPGVNDMEIKDLAGCLRARQWTKNTVIFAALVFSNHAHQTAYVARCIAAFVLFSIATGAVYVFNDIIDIPSDREHPVKRFRPIASGRMSVAAGWMFSLLLLTVALVMAFALDVDFGGVVLAYVLLQVAYTYTLKRMVIVDVFAISLSFILRVVAGAVVIHVEISSWILICTMLLALFLALSKRRHELVLLSENAGSHRHILREYSPYLLDQMIGVTTSATLVAYIIFTLSEETTVKFGRMVFTVPFVLYGIFRYLYLVHMKEKGGQPEEILLTDIPLQIDILLYGLVALAVIYL